MIDNQDSVHLSQDCFGACEVLRDTIQGKRVGDLNELYWGVWKRAFIGLSHFLLTMPNNPRVMREIERTLNRRPIIRHTKYKKKVESPVLEVQRLLDALSELDSPYDQSLGVGKRARRRTSPGGDLLR